MSTRKSPHQLMLMRTKMMNLRWMKMMTRSILTSKPPLFQQKKVDNNLMKRKAAVISITTVLNEQDKATNIQIQDSDEKEMTGKVKVMRKLLAQNMNENKKKQQRHRKKAEKEILSSAKGTIQDGVKTSCSNKKNNNTNAPLISDTTNKNSLEKIISHK
eukprot:11119773-Ditylum_brightwellii.AAC.1